MSPSLKVCLLFGLALMAVWHYMTSGKKRKNGSHHPEAPGPKPWPIIGSLHLMDGYKVGLFKSTHKVFVAGMRAISKVKANKNLCPKTMMLDIGQKALFHGNLAPFLNEAERIVNTN